MHLVPYRVDRRQKRSHQAHVACCVRAVTNAIQRAVPGAAVEVELETGRVTVDGADGEQAIAQAVDAAGFGFEGRAEA